MGDLPKELASLRVGTCLALLLEDSGSPALLAVWLPAALRKWPEGLDIARPWLEGSGLLDGSGALVEALVLGFRALLVLSLLGLGTRWSLALVAALGAVVLPLAQLVGPTVHNHHLFWFLCILASTGASAGATWSVDAWLGRRRAAPVVWSGAQARVAVAAARLILGLLYFFPGSWKMRTSGFDWFGAQALTQLFHSKWYQFDFVPWLRIDRYPELLSFGGASIVLLELSFPLLVLTQLGRTVALLGGLTFHVLSAQLLGIAFAPLWLCYGVLVDWRRVDAWLRSERLAQRASGILRTAAQTMRALTAGKLRRALGRAQLVGAVGALGAGGLLVQGLRGEQQGWPWACYPTFQWIVPDVQHDVLASVGSGEAASVYPRPEEARSRSQREWGQVYALLGGYGGDERALHEARCAYAELLVADGRLPRRMPGPTPVELYEVLRPTAPERWNEPPRVRRLLDRCDVDPARLMKTP